MLFGGVCWGSGSRVSDTNNQGCSVLGASHVSMPFRFLCNGSMDLSINENRVGGCWDGWWLYKVHDCHSTDVSSRLVVLGLWCVFCTKVTAGHNNTTTHCRNRTWLMRKSAVHTVQIKKVLQDKNRTNMIIIIINWISHSIQNTNSTEWSLSPICCDSVIAVCAKCWHWLNTSVNTVVLLIGGIWLCCKMIF